MSSLNIQADFTASPVLLAQDLQTELGIQSTEEMNRLLESASVGFESGYWQFAKTITPVLSHENYALVKSLLAERLARRREFS